MTPEPVLECQTCGRVLKKLTREEAQQVADKPYNFVVFCSDRCKNDEMQRGGYI